MQLGKNFWIKRRIGWTYWEDRRQYTQKRLDTILETKALGTDKRDGFRDLLNGIVDHEANIAWKVRFFKYSSLLFRFLNPLLALASLLTTAMSYSRWCEGPDWLVDVNLFITIGLAVSTTFASILQASRRFVQACDYAVRLAQFRETFLIRLAECDNSKTNWYLTLHQEMYTELVKYAKELIDLFPAGSPASGTVDSSS